MGYAAASPVPRSLVIDLGGMLAGQGAQSCEPKRQAAYMETTSGFYGTLAFVNPNVLGIFCSLLAALLHCAPLIAYFR